MAEKKKVARSRALAAKVVFAALTILKRNDGSLQGKEVFEQVGEAVEFDDWARHIYEKTGNIRWKAILHFFSIDCVKAGFLVKKDGVWYLTPEGEVALKSGEEKLLAQATEAYKKWKKEQTGGLPDEEEAEEEVSLPKGIPLDEIEGMARDSAVNHIGGLNPYEFQDLCAALLRGMGYHTPFIAPKGKDGGIDIIAYNDPLGASTPRIKAQVKHRMDTKAPPKEVRELMGLINKEGEVGIFISTGGFTTEARAEAAKSSTHIELIDLGRFIKLWKEFHSKMSDEDKGRMEMTAVYFVRN